MNHCKTWEEITAELLAADEAVWPFTMPREWNRASTPPPQNVDPAKVRPSHSPQEDAR